jgi:hypothetical protein
LGFPQPGKAIDAGEGYERRQPALVVAEAVVRVATIRRGLEERDHDIRRHVIDIPIQRGIVV